MHVHAYICMNVCAYRRYMEDTLCLLHMHRTHTYVTYFLQLLSALLFEACLSLNLEITDWLDRLTAQQATSMDLNINSMARILMNYCVTMRKLAHRKHLENVAEGIQQHFWWASGTRLTRDSRLHGSPGWLSVAMINTLTKGSLGRKGFLSSHRLYNPPSMEDEVGV